MKNKTGDSGKFSLWLWRADDNDISLAEIDEVMDKIIDIVEEKGLLVGGTCSINNENDEVYTLFK